MSEIKSVFISYRRDDSAGHTGRLFDYISANLSNVNVFMDVMGIDPGEDWKQSIKTNIDGCSVMLVIIGRHWLKIADTYGRRRIDIPDDPVRYEIELGINNRNVRVIPVTVGGAKLPQHLGLPEDVADLLAANAVRIDDDTFHDDAERLVRKIRTFLDGNPDKLTSLIDVYGIRMDNLILEPGWGKMSLDSIARIRNGRAVRRNNYEEGEYPLYNSTGIAEYINEFQHENDSLLFSSNIRIDERPNVFRVTGEFAAFPHLYVIEPDLHFVVLDYLWFILSYYDYRELIARSTSTGSFSRIMRRDLASLLIPVPSLAVQIEVYNRVLNLIDEIELIRESLRAQLRLADELEISLIKQYLQGDNNE